MVDAYHFGRTERVTAANGSYTIPNLPNGTFQVELAPQAGWTDTNPSSGIQQVIISNGAIVSNVNFVTTQDPPLVVTSVTPSANGFDITFNQAVDPTKVHLYDGLNFATGSASNFDFADNGGYGDLLVTLAGSTAAINGSLVFDAGDLTAHWIETSGPLTPSTAYDLTLQQPADQRIDYGFWSQSGTGLNGQVNGNVTESVTTSSSTAPVISVPSFARGPGQPVNVFANGTAGTASTAASGLPS